MDQGTYRNRNIDRRGIQSLDRQIERYRENQIYPDGGTQSIDKQRERDKQQLDRDRYISVDRYINSKIDKKKYKEIMINRKRRIKKKFKKGIIDRQQILDRQIDRQIDSVSCCESCSAHDVINRMRLSN